MGLSKDTQNPAAPEQRVNRLVARLRNQALWDSLLFFLPPLCVAIYPALYLYLNAWIAAVTFCALSVAVVGVGGVVVVIRTRHSSPSTGFAARLVDEKAGAEDRFLTLATIDASISPAALLGRLRAEAAGLLERIDFRREFPYRIKRSCYWSFLVSLIAAFLFHLSMPLLGSARREPPAYAKISQLAEKMAQRPRLSALARELQSLAAKLQQPTVSDQEKQASIHKNLEEVEKQQKQEKEEDSRSLLGEASSTLKDLEQQSGQNQQNDSEKSGAGVRSDLSQETEGQRGQSSGSGDSKGGQNAEQRQEMHQGQSAQGNAQGQGKEKSQQSQGDGKNDPSESSRQSDKNGGQELTGKKSGGAQQLGRSRPEKIPDGTPPAERFYKPGEEGKQGVKGAGYVTVQLPEELSSDSKGETNSATQTKESRAYPKAPVSNVPLPAHVPEAPMEKQQLPLEYRGIIR
ncbi:MAG TPA: hypothetical protein VIE89_07605 [Candidatus Binatia bacterium]